ncbi:peptidase inhibitor family I36 protein [Actinomadura syzygii]|uniref:peptidase inhibitor family I36 protein n=1 Tax=Actinomadura syzygii TaxID=1427538 RepID=UPI0016520BD2|nr:peptidase inhibitor family I36 protein [Actinomadura syzygii]
MPAGTGACTTGKFCLWEKTNYDGQLLVRINPVPGGRHVGLSNYGAISGYNATNQGQRVWEGYKDGRCTGRSVPIPRYTHFSDITRNGLYHGIGCITHS